MQKYDDFGRPIYETAEEYNRAHKTTGSAYAYDRPREDAYQQNATRQVHHLVNHIIITKIILMKTIFMIVINGHIMDWKNDIL